MVKKTYRRGEQRLTAELGRVRTDLPSVDRPQLAPVHLQQISVVGDAARAAAGSGSRLGRVGGRVMFVIAALPFAAALLVGAVVLLLHAI